MINPMLIYGTPNFNDRMGLLSASKKETGQRSKPKPKPKTAYEAQILADQIAANVNSAAKSGITFGSYGGRSTPKGPDKTKRIGEEVLTRGPGGRFSSSMFFNVNKTPRTAYESDIRDRQKNQGLRNTNWQDFLIRPGMVGMHKPDENSMALQEAYQTAETKTTGFTPKDQRDPNYAKNFVALELDRGGKMLDTDLKQMFREEKVLSDVGLVRRKPRLGYL